MTSTPRRPARRRNTRRPGERAGLALVEVLRQARHLLATEGLEAVTMRQLAARLGVAPNALYSHFADKSALIDGLLDALLAEVPTPPLPPAARWQDALVDLMRASRRLLLSHPDLIPLYLSRATRGPNALRLGEATLALLALGGITGQPAVDSLRILLIYTFGFAAQEAPRAADPLPAERRARSEAAFSAPTAPARVRQLSRPLARHADDRTFAKGLRWILAGIAAEARAQ